MLRNSKNLEGCAIGATDGTIGEVQDLYFDDELGPSAISSSPPARGLRTARS